MIVYDTEERLVMENEECAQLIMADFVYLLGIIYPFGELNIMGIYTDKRSLVKAYDKLVEEDARCTDLKHPEIPQIYKIPLNRFLGEMVEWTKIEDKHYFCSESNIETVCIDEIR